MKNCVLCTVVEVEVFYVISLMQKLLIYSKCLLSNQENQICFVLCYSSSKEKKKKPKKFQTVEIHSREMGKRL